MRRTQNIPTICRMCEQGCGLEVTVKNGRPVGVKGAKEHPYNRGWICAKGRAAIDFFNSPLRLHSPLIRRKGRFLPVDWDEALDFAEQELKRLRERHGPQSLAIYHGEGTGHQEIKYYMKRFANVYGTPNFMGVGSICNASRTIADTVTLGGVTKPDIPNTDFLIIWGANPFVSHEPAPPRELSRLKKRGGQIVVIDPRKTETGSKADYHLAVRPGRDEILILNMLHVIVREELWDKEFAEQWVHGFEDFAREVKENRFSPEEGETLTGIAPELVRHVACSYASTRPACISMGNGLEHHGNGISTMRLLAVMKAITGNLDIPGGDLFTPKPRLEDMTRPLPEPSMPPIGAEKFPLFCKARKEGHAMCLSEAILQGDPYPIKGMAIAGGNPSLEWPNSSQVRKALRELQFLMVIDVVRSPDSQYADLILPACTFLERDEHRVNVYHNLSIIALRREVVEPLHGFPDQMIWVKLAERMGFGKYFPWKTCKEGVDYILGGLDTDYHDLVSRGGIYEYGKRRYKKYEDQGFNTETGKVEILSGQLKGFGYDPFPIRKEILHPVEASADFPLFLTTGGNLHCYLHWQYRYIPGLRRMAPDPMFEIHPDTALKYGLSEGGMSEIETSCGKIQLKARLTPKIRPDTIHVPQGWEEANANELTGSESADPVSGFPNLKSLRCRIRKLYHD
ncbi:MAG: molybdopterin-dependent oxidoreductase [Desulfobacteraceae bacterium]|nr:molybdopterin-dependent oxidoreductase [Desulfobacteraceae bacterium]